MPLRGPTRRERDHKKALTSPQALLIQIEDELDRGDPDYAEQLLAQLPPILPPDLEGRAGICAYELEDLDQAQGRLARAVTADPKNADAHYYLGLTAIELGAFESAVEAWIRTRDLDLAAPRPDWKLSAETFEAEVEAALESLPEKAKRLLANIPIFHEEYPDQHLVEDGQDPRVLGLFMGDPIHDQASLSLSSIHLYERNIERDCRSREELREQIRITLIHETGHFFGLDEQALHAMGLG